jgi:hypothetical protein
MEFLDCNMSYGPDTMRGQLPGCPDIAELTRRMEQTGVMGGLAYYAMTEPIQGNASVACDILSARADNKKIYGVWSLLPFCTGEIAPPAELPFAMKRNGIAALTLNPKACRFLPVASVIGDYLEMARERAIPVLFNTGRGLILENVESLMEDFKDLTAVLTFENCWPSDRLLRPFLENYHNLYLDMTYMQTAAGLPDIVNKYSARRILFGSGYPECYMGAHMTVVKHAEIGGEDKALIAGGNLARIIEEARYD